MVRLAREPAHRHMSNYELRLMAEDIIDGPKRTASGPTPRARAHNRGVGA
jgi:hypothetical protein